MFTIPYLPAELLTVDYFLTVLSVLVIFALYDEDHLFLVNLYTHDDVCGTFKLFSVVWFCELCVGVNINDTFGHNLRTRA